MSTQEVESAKPMAEEVTETVDAPVVTEVSNEPKVGILIGQCKWWSDKLGYGFVTVQQGDMKGKDIFVHHTGVRPLNSNYRTLKKGEYVNFDVVEGANGLQGTNVTGIGGGSLICDVNPYIKPVMRTSPMHPMIPITGPHIPPLQHHFRPYAPRTRPVSAPALNASPIRQRRASPFTAASAPKVAE